MRQNDQFFCEYKINFQLPFNLGSTMFFIVQVNFAITVITIETNLVSKLGTLI